MKTGLIVCGVLQLLLSNITGTGKNAKGILNISLLIGGVILIGVALHGLFKGE